MNTYQVPEDSPSAGSSSKPDAAKHEAQEVGNEGKQAAAHVAATAKDEAGNVAQEVGTQAKNLVGELGDDLRTQAGAQQQKVAEGLRSISDELRSMAENNSGEAGTATHWVHEAARRTGSAAGWLDQRDPGELVQEVKRFARQRPGAFLAIAAGAGLLAGRLTRGLAGGGDSQSGTTSARNDSGVPRKLPPTPNYQLVSEGTGAYDPDSVYPPVPEVAPPTVTTAGAAGTQTGMGVPAEPRFLSDEEEGLRP
ncbi:hypothetical protein IV498_14530 [Paenarthrobacter sp. Z7-10]|uniref:hypothetical protein n=1 Tax=Paenarthrobacter sp. Z7-10 TaxID=2787635 RepID=UPI0022A955F0|nr:hypothetical protein [Paenarthrobacter sp. Z7-10]MCZ2404360.1 hypothetical protein [Paenarthrobacter sp. Z7-10]